MLAARFAVLRAAVPPESLPVYRPREHLKGLDVELVDRAQGELVRGGRGELVRGGGGSWLGRAWEHLGWSCSWWAGHRGSWYEGDGGRGVERGGRRDNC